MTKCHLWLNESGAVDTKDLDIVHRHLGCTVMEQKALFRIQVPLPRKSGRYGGFGFKPALFILEKHSPDFEFLSSQDALDIASMEVKRY